MLSLNIYGAATWGGSIPYFGNQFFLPLVLFFIIHFFHTNSPRWLWAGAMFAGFSFLGHPLPAVGFIFPLSLILIFFYPEKGITWKLKTRLKYLFKFLSGATLSGFILLGYVVTDFVFNFFARVRGLAGIAGNIGGVTDSSGGGAVSETGKAIASFYKDQIQTLFTGTNNLMFALLIIGAAIFFALFVLSFIFKRKKFIFFQILPFVLMTGYTAGHVVYNLTGHNFFPQGLYRTFWPFPIIVAALVASLWSPIFYWKHKTLKNSNEIQNSQTISRDYKNIAKNITLNLFNIGAALLFIVVAYFVFINGKDLLFDRIHAKSDTSSAFPEILSLKLGKEDQEKLKKELLPSFIDPNDKNKRLYESDATVNIWWNYFYDTPLARGYIDPPIGTDRRGSFFLLDIAVGNGVLEKEFKFPTAMAKNYAQFLMDWYSIYYFEGGHLSPNANVGPSPYLADVFEKKEDVTTYGAILRYESKSGRPEARFDLSQTLKYYKVKEDLVSPIVHATNSPAVLIISDFPAYEQVWRMLAGENLNSKYVVTVNKDKFIDSYNKKDLENFDAVILHDYDYKNKQKSFDMLKDYVQKGGKLFIDTGGEVKDSESNDLSDFFPFKETQRKELTTSWDLKPEEDPITHGIDFSKFGPPIFNKNPWKFSYPKEISDSSVKILLKNHNKPILITKNLGSGKIIWSGMNLPYHYVQYTNQEESKFFRQILTQLIPLTKNEVIPVNVKWERPESIIVIGDKKAKGLLIKEENYDENWGLNKIKGGSEPLKIYNSGPTYPGFMYIPLKDSTNYQLKLTFHGILIAWIYSLVSFISIVVIMEKIIFNGRFIGSRIDYYVLKLRKKAFSWWEKEEELE
ncbi:hypothetical protein HY025_05145 [Candidatus Daviesbacteria bacterium]|nr:hypothetical protein [Candidatus Daviesbacteria bacterium]